MKTEFDAAFLKVLKKVKDTNLLSKVKDVVVQCESSQNIEEIKNCKKLSGFENYYRIRMGDYRIGLEKIDTQTIRIITMAHRKDIYRNFP